MKIIDIFCWGLGSAVLVIIAVSITAIIEHNINKDKELHENKLY